MPYIGKGPGFGVRNRYVYIATVGQTSFTGADSGSLTLAYTDSLYMDVFQNGVCLVPTTDYAASTGTSVVLVAGASADDTVEMVVYDIFSVADAVSQSAGGSFAGNVGMGGTLSVTGDLTLSNIAGGAVFNEAGADVDFRVESDTVTHALFVQGSDGNVGIGTVTATATLTVEGNVVAKTDTDTSNTGSVTLDFAANQNFVLTLTGNVTLANPSTEVVGQSGFITLIQDGTGGRTLSLGTDYETAGAAGITLTATASATDIVPYVVAAAGRILLGAPQLAFS
jgi:hypothetical protein